MTAHLKKATKLKDGFDELKIQQILREENLHAYALANLGSTVQVTETKHNPIIYLKWLAVWKQDK